MSYDFPRQNAIPAVPLASGVGSVPVDVDAIDGLLALTEAQDADAAVRRKAAANALRAYRLKLEDQGYPSVPVSSPDLYRADDPKTHSAGKAPWITQWQVLALIADERQHREWLIHKDNHTNTGIVCDGLRAVDIDIDSPTVAARVHVLALLHFGTAPERYRDNSCRLLLVYAAAEGKPGKRVLASRSLKNDNGLPSKVEILGTGQQFVCAGLHPSGAPIKWRYGDGDGPGPRDGLAAITEDDIDGFFAACAADDILDADPDAGTAKAAKPDRPPPTRDPVAPLAILREVVAAIPNPETTTRDTWLRIGGAVHFETAKSDEGLEIFTEWALKHPDYGAAPKAERAACEKLWESFRYDHDDPCTIGTLMHYARVAMGRDWRPDGWDDAYWRHPKPDAADEFEATEDAPAANAPAKAPSGDGAPSGGAEDGTVAVVPTGGAAAPGEVLKPADLTEDGVALRFARKYESRLRYDHSAGTWFGWIGARWAKDETGVALNLSRDMCRALMFVTGEAWLGQLKTAKHVVEAARVDRRLAVKAGAWDRHPLLLGTPGGTVDLTTGELRPARPDECMTKSTSVAPAPAGTPCPIWDSFLTEATGGDEAMIRYLHAVGGYALTADTREDALFFLYGPGGNGKSVFLTVLREIMADYAAQAEKDTFTAARGGRHSADLAMLVGARLVAVAETEKGQAWNESLIKNATGRDPITAHFMHRDYFTFVPAFKLLVIGNHKPAVKAVDDGIKRRMHLLPFTHKPEKVDRFLGDKLRPEYPAILRRFIDGCLAWRRDGLVQPPVVRKATDAYLAEQDTFARWLEECCEDDAKAFTPTETLMGSFARYSHAGMDEKEFADEMKARGYQRGRETHRGMKRRGFRGIKLLDDDDSFDA